MHKKAVFCVKMHQAGRRRLLAAADADLVGKTLSDRNVKIEISKKFYGGEKAAIEEVIRLLEKCDMANLIGNNLISELHERGVINREYAKKIGGVLHLQIIKMEM